MSYGIENPDRLFADILRIVREQLEKAVAETSAPGDLRERIHAVRTCLKKTRSVLRLLRPSVSPEFYEAENRRFRDLGRRLAPMRDAFVQLSSFDALEMPADNPAAQYGRQVLATQHDLQFKKAVAELDAVRPLLSEALAQVDQWPVAQFGSAELCRGMCVAYRSARKAFRKAEKDPAPKTLHGWRGKTKSFWHMLRVCEPFLPKLLQQQCKYADKLGNQLGDYHDLTVLMATLDGLPKAIQGRKPLRNQLSKRCGKLQVCALKLGAKAFELKPKVWIKKLACRLPSK